MLSLKFTLLLLVAGLAAANISDLNSIFLGGLHNMHSQKSCDKRSEPFERHVVVDTLDKALEVGLNKTFHDKFECLQRIFDQKLIDMQHFYKLKLKESSPVAAAVAQQPTVDREGASTKKDKHHKKGGHKKTAVGDLLVGQTGFMFYSINQNGTVSDFKHESFKFVYPTSNKSEATQLEREIEAFNSDMFALKAIMSNIKRNIKVRENLLKAIKSNEEELEAEEQNERETQRDKSPLIAGDITEEDVLRARELLAELKEKRLKKWNKRSRRSSVEEKGSKKDDKKKDKKPKKDEKKKDKKPKKGDKKKEPKKN